MSDLTPEEQDLLKTELFLEGRMVRCATCIAWERAGYKRNGCEQCDHSGYFVVVGRRLCSWHHYKTARYRIP